MKPYLIILLFFITSCNYYKPNKEDAFEKCKKCVLEKLNDKYQSFDFLKDYSHEKISSNKWSFAGTVYVNQTYYYIYNVETKYNDNGKWECTKTWTSRQ